MNEDYSGQAKRTRKYWIMGVSAGVVFILLIGSFFIYQGMKKTTICKTYRNSRKLCCRKRI